MVIKIVPIPPIRRALSRKFVEKNISIGINSGRYEVKSQFRAGTGKIGKTNNPFHYVVLESKIDVRCESDLEIEDIFLRTYVNGCPLGYIIWQRIKGYPLPCHLPNQLRNPEIYTSPYVDLTLCRNSENAITFGVPIPPFVSLEQDIYIELEGYIRMKTSLCSFIKGVSGEAQIPNIKWG